MQTKVNDNGVTRLATEADNLEKENFMKLHPEFFNSLPTSEERLAALEEAMLALMMGGMPSV